MRMDVDDLDAAILSHAHERLQKVARVASLTMEGRGVGLSDEQFDIVVARVRALVARGHLVARGDLNRPRFSEVRLPGAEDDDIAQRGDLRQ
jgi:hypothetical protein